MARFALLVLALSASVSLAACEGTARATGGSYYGETNGNTRDSSFRVFSGSLKGYSYKAVEELMRRAGKSVSKNNPVLVGTISDVNNVEQSTPFGRTITEQIGARMSQLGYKVAELKMRQGISIQNGATNPDSSGEFLYSRNVQDVSGSHKAALAVTGTYSVGADNVLVNLRLIDIRTGDLITAYDYELDKTADIRALIIKSNNKSDYFTSGWDY